MRCCSSLRRPQTPGACARQGGSSDDTQLTLRIPMRPEASSSPGKGAHNSSNAQIPPSGPVLAQRERVEARCRTATSRSLRGHDATPAADPRLERPGPGSRDPTRDVKLEHGCDASIGTARDTSIGRCASVAPTHKLRRTRNGQNSPERGRGSWILGTTGRIIGSYSACRRANQPAASSRGSHVADHLRARASRRATP